MNDIKTTSTPPISKENVLLSCLGFVFSITIWFVLVQWLRYRFQLFAVHKAIAFLSSSMLIGGLYSGIIAVIATLFLLEKITLRTWQKILSVQCGFSLYEILSSSFLVVTMGYFILISVAIICVCYISTIITSYYHKGYTRLMAIIFLAGMIAPLQAFSFVYFIAYPIAAKIQFLATSTICTFVSVVFSAYAFSKLCYMITPKTRWHILLILPVVLLSCFLFSINMYGLVNAIM